MTPPARKFEIGERVVLNGCPSIGKVRFAKLESTVLRVKPKAEDRWLYQTHWPDFPDDHRWYAEEEMDHAPAAR